MRYILLICGDDIVPSDVGETMLAATAKWVAEMDGRGVRKLGQALSSAKTATTVRVREGETLVSDGPFAETKEQIVGFDLIECEDLDEAIEVAAKHPMAGAGSVEVRPFWTG